MGTTAYFDCFSGVAGDMVLGALVDAGMPLAHLKGELGKLGITGYRLELSRKRRRAHIRGTNLHIRTVAELGDTRHATLRRLIERSRLAPSVKRLSLAIMERLARAEASVHGIPLANVHLHEVGAIDSVIDCVGAAIGFDYFGFDLVAASPLPLTRGRVSCAHGMLPVPAPATVELIKGIPLEPSPVADEIVTPTGAAILTAVTTHFGECPLQRIDRVGYGYGDKEFKDIPNVLRLLIGEGYPMVVIEATIDDMNPQVYEYVMEQLLDAGAVDATLQPVQMKKNRPGIVISCQAPWPIKERSMEVLLRETTTTGVRYYPINRRVLVRDLKTISTRYGKVRMKIARDKHLGIVKHIPEYEDMKKLAKKKRVPLLSIHHEILRKIK